MDADKSSCTPFFMSGEVISGFGRGSKQLGIPTANLPVEKFSEVLPTLNNGVYFGFASIPSVHSKVIPMVMNIGWSPYFKNKEKSVEVHILREFEADFYGEHLRVVVTNYLREERDFPGLDALIEAIQDDITCARAQLSQPEYGPLRQLTLLTDKSPPAYSGPMTIHPLLSEP
eukprot:TRINITY_DN2843_c0_g1_i1.p1 TRINITY_DN2843_c0_g1~~TRINITY_DN2843_c0_g1_i1.p1  ORF type:complete len:173 (-),score=14.60 TRINITY_DN2843_c0_g1_i1:114-632(-)